MQKSEDEKEKLDEYSKKKHYKVQKISPYNYKKLFLFRKLVFFQKSGQV